MRPCFAGGGILYECGGAYAGACNVTTGSCVCEEGFSGHSDVVPMNLKEWGGRVLACPVHVVTLKVMWAVVLLPLCANLYLYPSITRTVWGIYKRKRKTDGLQPAILFMNFVAGPAVIATTLALVVMKLASPDNGGAAVGIDLAPTIMYVVNTMACLCIALIHFLRSMKATLKGAKRARAALIGTTLEEDRTESMQRRHEEMVRQQKFYNQIWRFFVSTYVPMMFQDVPLLASVMISPMVHVQVSTTNGTNTTAAAAAAAAAVDGIDAKRVVAIVWVAGGVFLAFFGAATSWWTKGKVAAWFSPIMNMPMDDATSEKVHTLRNSSVGSHGALMKICLILGTVGAIVRVPPVWWTFTQSYWLPISRLLYNVNMHQGLRSLTTKRVDISEGLGIVKSKSARGASMLTRSFSKLLEKLLEKRSPRGRFRDDGAPENGGRGNKEEKYYLLGAKAATPPLSPDSSYVSADSTAPHLSGDKRSIDSGKTFSHGSKSSSITPAGNPDPLRTISNAESRGRRGRPV